MDQKDKDAKADAITFPSAVYRNGESKLVNSQEEADLAEKDGWGDKPNQDLPERERPERGDRPHPEQPIAETPKPKKKD